MGVADVLPYIGILAGGERTRRGIEGDNNFRTGRGALGTAAAATRAIAGGAGPLGQAAGGLGAGLGMAAGITDWADVMGMPMSEGGEIGTTIGLGGAGLAAGLACPALLPFMAGAGLVASTTGMAARSLDEAGHHTAAEGVSILGMGGSGALLGAGIGSVIPAVGTAVGAGIGGGAGLIAGGVMSLMEEDDPDSGIEITEDMHLTGEEGMGIGALAAGGALAGAAIGSIIPAVGTAIGAGVGAGVGAVGGLIASLWD